jgi:hypothetical protein
VAADLGASARGELIDPRTQLARRAHPSEQRRDLPTPLARARRVTMLDVAGLAEDPASDTTMSDAPLTAAHAQLMTEAG